MKFEILLVKTFSLKQEVNQTLPANAEKIKQNQKQPHVTLD